MPPTTDLAAIQALLERDRPWTAYAIGDLDPALVAHSAWHVSDTADPALLLVYRGFEPPILFTMGAPAAVGPLLREIDAPAVSLQVRDEMLGVLAEVYPRQDLQLMLRMSLAPGAFAQETPSDVRPIATGDLGALTTLYEDGFQRGEGPTFFAPAMLQQGTFYGVWEDRALIAVAGTHVYSPRLGVCTIGNVYTRSDRRGRGLARRATAAVVAHALDDAIQTIVLNVGRENRAAQRVYARLGFSTYCTFVEGDARRA